MHIILTLVTIVLCLVLFAMDHILNGKRGQNYVFTYNDSGKRVKIVVDVAPVIAQTDECTMQQLKKCTMDDRFSCGACKQPLAICNHFYSDTLVEINGVTANVPKNTSPNEGYCLALDENISQRKCSQKHGGKWILTTNANQTLLRFECFCSEPGFFVNSPVTGDCSVFVGCNNGAIKSQDWNLLSEIDCHCLPDFISNRDGQPSGTKSAAAPQCVAKNIFQLDNPPFPVLDTKFIDKFYMSALGVGDNEIRLPNPCLMDLASRTFVEGIGEVRTKIIEATQQEVAYCVSLNDAYTTVVVNDDYLLNNNGQYANGLMKFVDDEKNLAENEIVYEYFRTKIDQPDDPLQGRRVRYKNLNNMKFPYLTQGSGNLGGDGQLYTYAPIMNLATAPNSYVYVYSAPSPEPVEIIFGEWLSYMPVFMPPSFEASVRVFNGVIPFKPAYNNTQMYYAVWPMVPPRAFTGCFGTTGIMGSSRPEGAERVFAEHFCLPLRMDGEMNSYSRLFTGTMLKYTLKNQVYNKPISCGNANLLLKYRTNYNDKYDYVPPRKYLRFTGKFVTPADEHDEHLFTENAVGYEENDLGCGERKYSRYTFENHIVKFPHYYN